MNRDKKELQALRREVQRLRKQLNHVEQARYAERDFEKEAREEAQAENTEPRKGRKCPKCKSEMALLDLGARKYNICQGGSCGHKEKAK